MHFGNAIFSSEIFNGIFRDYHEILFESMIFLVKFLKFYRIGRKPCAIRYAYGSWKVQLEKPEVGKF